MPGCCPRARHCVAPPACPAMVAITTAPPVARVPISGLRGPTPRDRITRSGRERSPRAPAVTCAEIDPPADRLEDLLHDPQAQPGGAAPVTGADVFGRQAGPDSERVCQTAVGDPMTMSSPVRVHVTSMGASRLCRKRSPAGWSARAATLGVDRDRTDVVAHRQPQLRCNQPRRRRQR